MIDYQIHPIKLGSSSRNELNSDKCLHKLHSTLMNTLEKIVPILDCSISGVNVTIV